MRNHDIGIDLGNSKFSICVKNEGIVASEASFLAYCGENLTDDSVVAIGDTAREMFERSHPGITVVTPMREGIVVDSRAAGLILKRLAKKAGLRWGWSKPKTLVAALFGSSDVERKAFHNVAQSLSRIQPIVIDEPIAAANSTSIDMSLPYANMIIDVGDGATEAIVMSQGKTILGNSMRFGGYDAETLLMDHIRKQLGLVISRTQAKAIKENLVTEPGRQSIAIKGIAVHGRIPMSKQIPVLDIQCVMDRVADNIATFAANTLSNVAPEVSVDLIENGIHLCGGASRMAGVKERLAERSNLKIHLVDQPQQAVIQGLNRMLRYSKYY